MTVPLLRVDLPLPSCLRTVAGKSQIWSWTNHKRRLGLGGSLSRIQWAERQKEDQVRRLADGGRKDEENGGNKR